MTLPDAYLMLSIDDGLELSIMYHRDVGVTQVCEDASAIMGDAGRVTPEMTAATIERLAELMPVYFPDGEPVDVPKLVAALRKGAVLS